MTKYSPLTDREEVTQLRDECLQAIAEGYEFVWDIKNSEQARSIARHVNALAFTGHQVRRKYGGKIIETPDQMVGDVRLPMDEWLALFNLDQLFNMMPSVRGSLRGANPAYKGEPLDALVSYANRFLELLPAE